MTNHDERDDYDDDRWGRLLASDRVVRWPASVLWGLGLMQLIFTQAAFALMVLVHVVVEFVDGAKGLDDLLSYVQQEPDMLLVPVGWVLLSCCNIFVMRAANDMRRFRRYWRVVVATVLTLFALPFVYLAVIQLPLGIWIIAVLARRDVRARFEAVARGNMTPALPEPSNARRTGPA